MAAPGTEVTVRDAAVPRSAPTATDTGFMAGFTEEGPHQSAGLVRSLREFVAKYGDRVSFSLLYDAVDTFFRSGGARVYIAREVGPAPVAATIPIAGGTGDALIATAKSVGVWANGYDVVVAGAGPYTITVRDADDTVLAESGDLAAAADAVGFANDYVTFTLGGGTGLPVPATYVLAGGTDDHTNATAATLDTALGLFDVALGPGQVLAPGRTTSAAHASLLTHGLDRNRFALLDAPDGSTVSSLQTLTAASRLLGSDSQGKAWRGMLCYPWATIPGLTAGTTRTVPYSCVEAGVMARVDQGGNANVAAAGDQGIATYPLGLTAEFPDELDRQTLNDAGVSLARVVNEQIKMYGYRTLVDPAVNDSWLQATNVRLAMAIKARAEVIAERFVFRQIDGEGLVISEFNGQLAAMLGQYWTARALFGATPDDAYQVNTGAAINTPETLAAGELHAQLAVRMSPFAERVLIDVVKIPITQTL